MNAHVFIDAENISPDIGFKTVEKFRRDYTICKVDVIGKADILSQKYLSAGSPYRVQNCYYGKNSADTWLCMEIAKTIFEEPEIEAIIIVSSDRDFLPAIKLAVEKKKVIIVVSNGSGHGNLRRLLKELRIDAGDVQLVDYRDGLEITDNTPKKKKSLSELMKNAKPTFIDAQAKKLRKFYQRMLPATEIFFKKREDQIKFIFVKHENQLTEIPFIDGMNVGTFSNVLRELRVIGKKTNIDKLITRSLLQQRNKKVYLQSSEDFIPDDLPKKQLPFDNLSNKILQYFTDNNSKVKIIFVKNGDELFEIPFVEGMDAKIFLQLLIEKQITYSAEDFEKIVTESLLKVSDEKIYFLDEVESDEEELQTVEEENFDELQNLQTVFINFGGELIEIPFVEGMEYKNFLEILSYFGIVGDSKFIHKVISDSLLKISGGKIYLAADDEDFFDDDFNILDRLSVEARNFISENKSRLKFINLTYEGYFYEIPFVNGINYAPAAKILLELKVIKKFEDARKVFVNNGFKIINGAIYQ